MSKNQEQMKELINDVRTGKTDKEVLCKEIQKDVNCLIYPVFGEDYKKLSPRAIIDICTNLDSIDVDKNIMRQIATRVSVFMFNLIDNSTIKIDDDYEYEYGRIKEDKELFDIIKDNSRIFKDFKAYDNAPDNIKSLSRVQTIMMELYGYEMHSVDEIETLLDIDSAFILKLIAMMKDNILGISSVVENMSDYASFDEEETDDSDIKIYGAEQKAAETEAADEYEAYEPENADLPDNESDEGTENDESDDEDSDEGVLFEYDMNGYENNDFDDVPVRGVSLMDKLTAFVGRVFPGVPRARRRNVVYASMVVILVVIILIVSIAAMAGGNRRKANNKNNSNEWKPMELPAYWETRGLNFDGTVWFQKEVEIPADWNGKEISFHLAMIDDDDVTYFNGKEIGRTSGCNTMRTYKIPAALAKAGKGVITIRAIDYGGEGGIHGEPQQMYMEANDKKISLAGNWNYHTGVSMTGAPSRPLSPEGTGWPTSCYPTVLYNAMIHPFTVFPIKGAIWYQGENNVGFDEQYRVLFQSMITDWRRAWKQDFPFYFVQLANYLKPEEVQPDSKWAALRDAQAHALHLPNTGMACAIDLGEAYDIHPKNKQEVGKRLAQAALTKTYNKGTYEVPAFLGYRISGRTLILTFDQEVVAKEGAPKGFILAGPDGKYVPAQATIRGKEVILQSDRIEIPTAACYAWADNPVCNLYGKSGLPVPPFRTRE